MSTHTPPVLCFDSRDLLDERKREELLLITIQQIYVLCKQGRKEESVKLFEVLTSTGMYPSRLDWFLMLTQSSISDPFVREIARTNLLVSNPRDNPFFAHRLLHCTMKLSNKDQPFQYQSTILRQNQEAVDLSCFKFSGVARSTANRLSSYSKASTSAAVNTLSVLNAAANARNETGRRAFKSLIPLLEKRPHDVGLLLTIIQLYVLMNNLPSAIAHLESFFNRLDQSSNKSDQDVRYAPGLVSIAVALYTQQGRHSSAKAVLATAATYWMSKKNTNDDGDEGSSMDTALLHKAEVSLLKSGVAGDAAVARDIFAEL